MTISKNRNPSWVLGLAALLLAVLSGCSTPLSKGWDAFEKDQFTQAGKEWSAAKKDEVKALVKKAEAAEKIVELDQKALDARKGNKLHQAVQYRIYLTQVDQWPKDKWIERSKTLQAILDKSLGVVSEARKNLQNKYDVALKCGKSRYKADEYKKAKKCFYKATKLSHSYKKMKINVTDTAFMIAAVNQALAIERQMEAERRAAVAAQRRYEAEQAALLLKQKQEAEAKHQLEELARIKAEQIRAEKAAKKKRRWMAFLKKGRPLKPLVTTVGIPSIRTGRFSRIGQKIKFQAGAQFPILRKKGLRAEDIFALEISINRDDKATYLRNYSKSRGNLLQMPQIVSGKKHYYTEGYKGGRYYTEVENVRSGNKYEVKAVIYKIPVVH